MHIKVFGIQRTGTNYLAFLVGNNMNLDRSTPVLNDPGVLQGESGWKHGPIPRIDNIDETLRRAANNKAVILIKNPYTWYTSILKWIMPAKATSYDGFLGITPAHVFKKYNSLYEDHKDFLLGNNTNTVYTDSILIRYEDLIANTNKIIQGAADRFNVTLNNGFIDTNMVLQSAPFTESIRNYYIAQKPLYDEKTIEKVDDAVDWELMKFYGYRRLGDDT